MVSIYIYQSNIKNCMYINVLLYIYIECVCIYILFFFKCHDYLLYVLYWQGGYTCPKIYYTYINIQCYILQYFIGFYFIWQYILYMDMQYMYITCTYTYSMYLCNIQYLHNRTEKHDNVQTHTLMTHSIKVNYRIICSGSVCTEQWGSETELKLVLNLQQTSLVKHRVNNRVQPT